MRTLLATLLMLCVGSLTVASTAAADANASTDVTIGGTVTVPLPAALEPCTHCPGMATVTFNAVL